MYTMRHQTLVSLDALAIRHLRLMLHVSIQLQKRAPCHTQLLFFVSVRWIFTFRGSDILLHLSSMICLLMKHLHNIMTRFTIFSLPM